MTFMLEAGVETHVSAPADQAGMESITRLANGNYVVTWNTGTLLPGLTSGWYWADVHMQMYDGDGNAIGDVQTVNTLTDEDQAASQVIAQADGGFIVVWESDHYDPASIPAETFIQIGSTINAQRFDAQGNRIAFTSGDDNSGEVILSTGGADFSPVSTALTDGSTVISWFSNTDTSTNLSTRHYAADGHLLDSSDVSIGLINLQKLTALNDGTYVRTTTHIVPGTGTSLEVFVQKFAADGTALGSESQVNTFVTNQQTAPAVAVLSDGGFVVTWQSRLQDGSLYGVYGQVFNSSGAKAGSEFRVNTWTDNNQQTSEVHALDDGTFVVAWNSTLQDGSGTGAYFQQFAADGTRLGSEVRIADETIGNQSRPHLTAIDGGFVVAWTGVDTDGDYSIFQRAYQAVGTHGTDGYDSLGGNADANVLYGEGGNDVIAGDAGNDLLFGGNGGDWIDGGTGQDTMYGGAGDDAFVINDAGDRAQEYVGSGLDTVYASVTHALGANVENLTLTGTGNINGAGNAADNLIFGNDGNNLVAAASGNDTVFGGLGVDTLQGGDGNDIVNDYEGGASTNRNLLDGGAGDDILVGEAYDRFDGGAGFDSATIDFSNYFNATGLAVNLSLASAFGGGIRNFVGGGGIVGVESTTILATAGDDIVSDAAWNGRAYGAGGVDRLYGNSGDDMLLGGAGNDSVDGGAGQDWLYGGDGNDVARGGDGNDHIGDVVQRVVPTGPNSTAPVQIDPFLNLTFEDYGDTGADTFFGDAGDDIIYGWGGNDRLDGGEGNDTLVGGAGADGMVGGAGDDAYYVDNAADAVTEVSNGGTDTVFSEISYVLSSTQAIENLTLLSDLAINGTGNSLNNILTGNNAANQLDGRTGADIMEGHGGNDTYIVDNDHDQVWEGDNDGVDTVRSTVSWDLGPNVENLILLGTADLQGNGNDLANAITGNSGNNVLDGQWGADTLSGGLGDDSYYVDNSADVVVEKSAQGTDLVMASASYSIAAAYVENLTLLGFGDIGATGNGLTNILTGNAGNNWIDGGAGADVMTGRAGNDTYYVDNSGDKTIETNADLSDSGGIDTVMSTLALTLGTNLENLTLLGSAGIGGTGNALNNIITGNSGNNLLSALAGDDLIDGGTGADTMSGGLGNDSFVVDNVLDRALEANGGGNDIVFASVSFSTTNQYLETVILTGSADINATGNAFAETLTGNTGANSLSGAGGNDILTGGGGNDTLSGGSGADRFVFGLGSGIDTVTDFSGALGDVLDLSAYSGGTAFGGGITLTQSGAATIVDLGGGNTITLNNTLATNPALLSHIVW